MPLIVENGAGLVDADAYAARATVVAYWTNLNDPAFGAAAEAAQDAAIRRATQFLDAEWGSRFKGDRKTDSQALEWPRLDAAPYADDEIPLKLVQAVAELAKLGLSGPIAGSGAAGLAPSQTQIAKMKAGSVEIEYRDDLKAKIEADHTDKFYLIKRLLWPVLKSGGLNRGLSR